jgi:hypothetical protein
MLLVFRKNLLIETAATSTMFTVTYQNKRRHNLEDHNKKLTDYKFELKVRAKARAGYLILL